MEKIKTDKTVFDKLEHDLRCDIYRRHLLPGEKLNSELQLSRKYHISRGSVRKALLSLVKDGLLTRVRGSGTFVADKILLSPKNHHSPQTKDRQILFLSFSTAFSEEVFLSRETYYPIYDGLGSVLNAYHYNLLTAHVDNSWTPPSCLVNHDVAGIVFHGRVRHDFIERYMADLPCVGLQHVDPGFNCSWVCINNYERSWLAVKHLYDLGHRKIAFYLASAETGSLNMERLQGFRRAMHYFDLPCPDEYCIIVRKNRRPDEAQQNIPIQEISEALRIFRRSDRPTALIIPCYLPPIKAALKNIGLRIPDDVSVVSGSNRPFQKNDGDFETFVCDRFDDVCAEGGLLLIEHIAHKDACDDKTILLRPVLYQGNTTKPLRRQI